MKSNKKIKCDKCGRIKRSRYIVQFKGKFLCSDCKPRINVSHRRTIEQALNKVYGVRGYMAKNGSVSAVINVPSVMAGRKVKLVLVK